MSASSCGRGRGGNPWNRGGQNGLSKNTHKAAEEKFRKAQQKNQAAVTKYLDNQEYESSSDEETLETESILNSIFKNYSQFGSNQGVEKTQQFLENAFQSGAGICLICIGSIKRADPVSLQVF